MCEKQIFAGRGFGNVRDHVPESSVFYVEKILNK